jgi:single-stranded-DNA-specific exonuclease
MSILGKNWKIKNANAEQNVMQKILENRGLYTQPQVQEFLKTSYKKGLHNPFLIKNMHKAVDRIATAIEKQEKIMIFGDYDVDGISGTAIMVHTLKILGAKISYRLPHRMEDGYGLSEKFIHEFAALGVGLLITVDCGVSCASQIALAADKGIDVIVTDHHTIPEQFPDRAFAVIHPMQKGCDYPFKGLTGAGVSFKLASALLTDRLGKDEKEEFLYSLLDLASLGTVADLGPLIDENRIIVKYGLMVLQNTKWPGLNYLKEYSGIPVDSKMGITDIGFKLGPRINAAGRIDTPYYALQLLLYDQPNEKGKLLAQHLDKLNQRRQQMVVEALLEAEEHFAAKQKSDKIFIAWSPNWHVGILGLIASKIVEKYSRPAIVLQDFGEHLIASARSQENFNIVSALTEHKHLLENFGGHAQAAGFSIKKENLEEFESAMTAYAEKALQDHNHEKSLSIDCEITEGDINDKLMELLDQMEPYGIGNEQPVFLLKKVYPNFVRKVGKESQHLHFQVEGKIKRFPVIAFKLGEHEGLLTDGQPIDIAFNLTKNEWKGNTQLQLRAIDFKRSA